jgi:DNA-binding MarR family transcriptional regulator
VSVEKRTRRLIPLIARKLASGESLPTNQREILFRLTLHGRETFDAHRAFDNQMDRGFVQFLRRYTADELRLLVRVLSEAADAPFLSLGGQPASAE